MTIREGEIEITAQASEEGEGSEKVPAEYTGEEIQLGFNWHYLLEFLTNAGAAEMAGSESAPADAASGESATAAATATATAREGRSPLRISFDFKDANASTQMSIAGETTYDYKYIVMPLRI